jgi:hypothetical protein
MSNVQKPASSTAKVQKLMLLPGSPLIKILKPDYYIIVDPGSLDTMYEPVDPDDEDYIDPDEEQQEEENSGLKAPSLSDITLVSKTMVTDKNKNQFVEFVFNVKNSVGEAVIGVQGYGQ